MALRNQPCHEQASQEQTVVEQTIVDFLQEANILLDKIGRFQRTFRRADLSAIGDAAERLYDALLWAEALVHNWANLVPMESSQNWGYSLLRSHAQVARQILNHRNMPVEVAHRLRDRGGLPIKIQA